MDEDMNCLRFMESSRPRDSTTPHRGFVATVDWLLAISIALAVIVSLVGIDFKVGRSIRAHAPLRILIIAILLGAVRGESGSRP